MATWVTTPLTSDAVDLVPEKFHADHAFAGVGGINLHHIAAYPKLVAHKVDVVALVLQIHQLLQQLVPRFLHPLPQRNHHAAIVDGIAQRINAGNARHDDDIPPFGQRRGGGMAQLVDLVVDGRVFFNIGIGGRNIRLRLIIVVVGDKVFHRIVGKELLELRAQLRGQGFVVGQDKGGTLDLLNDLSHGKGFAGAGDTEQRLFAIAAFDPLHQLVNRLRLVAGRLV